MRIRTEGAVGRTRVSLETSEEIAGIVFWQVELRSGRIGVQGPGTRVGPGLQGLGLVQAFVNNGRIGNQYR